jgi:hypothetical protein
MNDERIVARLLEIVAEEFRGIRLIIDDEELFFHDSSSSLPYLISASAE